LSHPAKPIGIGVPRRRFSFLAIALSVALLQRASADNAAQALPFFQDWSNTGLITTSVTELPTPMSWPGVPGIVGFNGNGLIAPIGVDPQTVLVDDETPTAHVIANQTDVGITNGGVAEFELANPVVALQGSANADAPYLLIHLDTTGRSNIKVSYNVRDIDSTTDNTNQQVALHYRVGTTGPFTNLPGAYIADATTGPSLATLVTPVEATLPAAVENQPLVQLRIMTTNAPMNDEWVGIDDIRIEESVAQTNPTGIGLATPATVIAGQPTLLAVNVTPGTNPESTGLAVTADLTPIGASPSQPFFDDGMNGDVVAGDNIFSFATTVAPSTSSGAKNLTATITDAQDRDGSATIQLTVQAPAEFFAIHDIQGTGSESPLLLQRVKTIGVVTGLRTGGLGYFIQAPDAESDGDPGTSEAADTDSSTSEGLLIFRRPAPGVPFVVPGDLIEVTGIVAEFPPGSPSTRRMTEISEEPTVRILSRGHALPSPVTLTAADAPPDGPLDALEEFEAMRVHVQSLRVVAPTEGDVAEATAFATSNGVFFGVIGSGARPMREPGLDPFAPEPPGLPPCLPPAPCVPRFDGNPERIRVDSDQQVGAVSLEVGTGQVVSGLVGPLNYEFDAYTIVPDPVQGPEFDVSDPGSIAGVSTPGGGQFTVASVNLQRLFDTVNDPATSDVVMLPAALDVRLTKLSELVRNVLQTPDIVGVSEAENLTVLQMLADRINADAEASPEYVAYLEEGNDPGGIDVGFLLKSSRVSVADVTQIELPGCIRTIPTTCHTFLFNGLLELLNDRPPLVLRAMVAGPQGLEFPVTVIANHLRSLNDVTDPLTGARVREKRRAQAEFLANLIQDRQSGDPNERIIVLGDMNAFQFNDGLVDSIGTIKGTPTPAGQVLLPSEDLVDPNLIDLVERVPADQRYSFVFASNAQELDHILITQNLEARFASLQHGRSNADFPESLRNVTDSAVRSSDHDALVANFHFSPPVSLSINDVMVTEGNEGITRAEFTVAIQGSQESEITVAFATEDGTGPNGAVAFQDYIPLSGSLAFPPGVSARTIVVDVIGDRRVEPDELFSVRLSGASSHATIARGTATGTILNDDVIPVLTIEDTSVDEHDKFARVRVRLPAPATQTIEVNFTTADGTATDGVGEPKADYAAATGTLQFIPGETSRTIEVAVLKDRLDESAETFFVDLAGATNATIGDGRAVVTIRDDDRRPRIRIRNARANEPATGTAVMTFRVALSAPSGRSVTVDFRTFDLTAVAGRDYEARTGTLTFAPGETEKTIGITILADGKREHHERFGVKLWHPAHGTLTDAIGIGTIERAYSSRHGA
jgi:predicted extracellular nuclease